MSEKIIDKSELTQFEVKLCNKVDEYSEEIVDLLKDLIKFDSRSYDAKTYSDLSDIAKFCNEFMKDAGFNSDIYGAPHLLKEENRTRKEWPNVISYIQASNELDDSTPFLQLNGHMDIVPFQEDKWEKGLGPLKPVVKDGKVYGRGSCDMKGGVAAEMMACKIFKEMCPEFSGKLQMWFIPDEELDGLYGAQYMCKNHLDIVNADATIIAEPSGQPPIQSPAIVVGEKGHKWLTFKVYGSSGHGSMPKPKSNALNKAARFINNSSKKWKLPKVKSPIGVMDLVKALISRFTLGNIIKILRDDSGEEPDPYNEEGLPLNAFFKTTLSFNQIEAGTKVNVIPDLCTFKTDIRVLPNVSDQDIYTSLGKYCTKIGYKIKLPEGFKNPQDGIKKIQKRPIDIIVEPISTTDGTFVSTEKPFTQLMARTFEDVYNRNRVFFFAPGGTDAVHMRMEGMHDVVVFGPSGFNAHDANESVVVEQLINTCKVYLLTAYRILVMKEI